MRHRHWQQYYIGLIERRIFLLAMHRKRRSRFVLFLIVRVHRCDVQTALDELATWEGPQDVGALDTLVLTRDVAVLSPDLSLRRPHFRLGAIEHD